MRKLWKRYLFGIATLMLAFGSGSAFAWPCDFLTSGGFIFFNGNQATFGAGGGCQGSGSDFSGHLEYVDHGTGLNVHGTSVTGYFEIDTSVDANGHPTGGRLVCGTATTNQFGDVDFAMRERDADEPGINDQFDLRLTQAGTQGGVVVYDTTSQCSPHFLGSQAPCAPADGGGGNVQLHEPVPPSTGSFGGSCPAAGGA